MILDVRNISKSFDGISVLDKVSFSLEKGTIMSVFGENGTGKTTLFNILSGFDRADAGSILYKNQEVSNLSAVELAKRGVGRVWQTPRVFQNMSVLDNLMLASRNHPGSLVVNYFVRPRRIWLEEVSRKRKSIEIASHVGLVDATNTTAGKLSFGQQKLLSIGMLIMYDAELLLLDEPFAGINARMVDDISRVILDLKENRKTVLMIEHNRQKAKMLSDDILIL